MIWEGVLTIWTETKQRVIILILLFLFVFNLSCIDYHVLPWIITKTTVNSVFIGHLEQNTNRFLNSVLSYQFINSLQHQIRLRITFKKMYFTQRKPVQKIKYYFLESSTIKEVSAKLRYIKKSKQIKLLHTLALGLKMSPLWRARATRFTSSFLIPSSSNCFGST